MPAPSFQGAGTAQSGTGAVTPAWPTHQTNDIALLVCESCGGEPVSLTTANGFAAVTNSPQATGATTSGTQVTVFWCRATSSSMASPVVADPGDHVYAIIVTFRGCVTSGNPWDVTAGGVKASASTTGNMTGLTTTVNDTMIVNVATRDISTASGVFSGEGNATVSLGTERSDAGTVSGNGGGACVVTAVRNNPGVVAVTTFTVTSSINAYLTIALKGDTTAPTQFPQPVPQGRIIAQQQWGTADLASWTALGWASSGTGGTVNVQSGGGRIAIDGVNGSYAESGSAYLATLNNTSYCRLPVSNWDFSVDIQSNNITAEAYCIVSMADANAGAGIANNGYTLSIDFTGQTTIQRRDFGGQVDLAFGLTTFALNTMFRFLWRRRGDFIGLKVWQVGSSMPATWTASVFDNHYRGPQYSVPMLGLLGGAAVNPTEVTFRNLMISTPTSRRGGLR